MRGYDISPDMVRLSLVNLYLHGFSDPHIYEYDTLTSQDRWNEYANVILANPPFMSPTGGIKPHNRFSVQSKRSEVLFVDYMAEHLSSTGRAGIIVPEGVIFQSQTAYKQLRKMLVREYLVAVISLPAGVFQPYSGVKTSVLILDKALSKQRGTVAFFKVENDGLSLGSQRRPIDKNDLPGVQADASKYLQKLRSGDDVKKMKLRHGLVVEKEKIAKGGEYCLSGERYVCDNIVYNKPISFVSLGHIFEKVQDVFDPILASYVPSSYIGLENIESRTGKVVGIIHDIDTNTIKSIKNCFAINDILYGKLRPILNKVWHSIQSGICSTDIFVLRSKSDLVIAKLFAYILRTKNFNDSVLQYISGAQLPRISWSDFANLPIPLPPLDMQKEIMAEIEGYQKVIDGARTVLDNYQPKIDIRPEWPLVELGELLTTVTPPCKIQKNNFLASGSFPIIDQSQNVIAGYTNDSSALIRPDRKPFVIFGDHTCIVKLATMPFAQGADGIKILLTDDKLDPKYLFHALKVRPIVPDGYQRHFLKLKEYQFPLPPLEVQKEIVTEIEAEQLLINANREIITKFEKKIEAVLASVWSDVAENKKA